MKKRKMDRFQIQKKDVYRGDILKCNYYDCYRHMDPSTPHVFYDFKGEVIKENALLIKVSNMFIDVDGVEDLEDFINLKRKYKKYADNDYVFLKNIPNKKESRYIDDNLKPGFESGITKKITFNELKEIRMKEKQK